MDTAELLDYCAKELLDDRTDLVEGDADNLWSDAYLLRQMNEAQRQLCRRAWVIIEYGIAPAGVIVLATGKVTYALHKSVLRVFDITPSTQTLPLGRDTDLALRDTSLLNRDPNSDFTAYELGESAALAGVSSLTGATDAFGTDAGTRMVRIYPPPAAAQNGVVLSMRVARLPITELTVDNTEAEPEVPTEFHLAICEYAAGKALTMPLVDADQKVEGRRLLEAFAETVRQARQERVRAEMGTGRWAFNSTTATLGR